jgi:hypothetical protein
MAEPERYNAWVAEKLEEVADILAVQDANPFRIDAYRRAAETIRGLDKSLEDIVDEQGFAGVDDLPGIGQSLARLLFQLVKTGRLPMLDRLRGAADPLVTLASVPGIGTRFARVLHEDLGIDSLEELEAAAYDGRLSEVRGFGVKRIAGIRDSLSARLGRIRRNRLHVGPGQAPIGEILDVDREYRAKADAGALYRITPRRFNPRREKWLPILHTVRSDHHYTALFSNTARAHELKKTNDWVVIYLDTDHHQRQYTVITAGSGPLFGKRIVRGREPECWDYYSNPETARDVTRPNRAAAIGGYR